MQTETQQETKNQASDFNIKSYIEECKKHWKWFAASIICIVGMAVLYLIVKQPVYERSAQVMIKEDTNPSSKLTAGLSMIQGMGGILGATSNVSNELIAMETPANVMEAVKRLHLDYDYSTREFLRKQSLYGKDLPIAVNISNMKDDDQAYMKIRLDKGHVKIYKLRKNKNKYSEAIEGRVNDVIKTPIGLITILPTKSYTGKEVMTIRLMKYAPVVMAKACSKKLDAGITEELASVIDLSYKDPIPQRAEDFINTLVNIYNEQWMRDENQLTDVTTRFIDQRINEIENQLGKVESNITAFQTATGSPDLAASTMINMSNANNVENQLVYLNNQLSMANFMLDFMRNHSNQNELLPANIISSDKIVSSQISEYNTIQQQRNNLVANSNATNPLVKDYDKQLQALKQSIAAALTNTVKQTNIQISGIQKFGNKSDAKVASTPNKAKYLLSAERDQKIKESLYIFLLQKREENILSQAFTPYKTRILSPPLGDIKPVEPKAALVLFIALIFSLILPAFVILVRQNLRLLMEEK